MKAWSASTLRWRLLISLLSLSGLAWMAVAVVGYGNARQEMDQLFDAELAGNARFLLDLTLDRPPAPGGVERIVHAGGRVHKYEKKLLVQIWNAERRLLLRSAKAPTMPLAERDGFSQRRIGDQRWRVFSLTDPGSGLRVQAAQVLDIRYRLGHEIAVAIWIPVLVLLPLLGILVWFVVGRAMMPLARLAWELQRRQSDNLRPLPENAAPGEVRPLVKALNRLFLRLDKTLENERRFTADAAHELRTPLAALRIHAQMAQRAHNPAVRSEFLDQLLVGIERITHLVEQLLILARMDAGRHSEPPRLIDPGAHLANVLTALTPLARNRHIDLHCVTECGCRIRFAPEALDILLRNLVDNALRYTPEGGQVEVRLQAVGGEIRLLVADSGPGICASEHKQVFERFFRGDNSGDSSGCGLGLSIVRRIAELYGAELILGRSRWSGLEVVVRFMSAADGSGSSP